MSQLLPTTLGKHGHCPVLLSHSPIALSVPRMLQTHSKNDIFIYKIAGNF